MHIEVRKMEVGPQPDVMSGSSPDSLEDHFVGLNIGTRKKTAPGRLHAKRGENFVEDDQVFQDINMLEQWNSPDRITFDDTESSDWERSNSSSMSWFDESEQETTIKVKNMMDNIDKFLFGEGHAPLPRVVAEECQQWKLRFPHLRVVGKAVDINCMEVPKNDQLCLEKDLTTADGAHKHPCNEDKDDNIEEDKEETYASHGTIECEPLLSHEFQLPHEPVMDSKAKLIQEALVDELTKHVWKEVVEPRMEEFMEQFSEKKEEENAYLSHKHFPSGARVTDSPRISGKHDKDKCISSSDTHLHLPLSAREMSHVTIAQSSNNEPFGFHRRHSDHISLSHRKCKNRLAPHKISEERDEGEDIMTRNSELHWNALDAENRLEFNTRMPEINDLQEDTLKRITLRAERLEFPSPRSTEAVEHLKPREKASISSNLNLRSRRKNERMKYSEKHYPQSKTRHVRLPAIEDNKWLTNNEASSPLYGRSSSALPKLAPKTLRPTMSSYKNMHGERTVSVIRDLPFKHGTTTVKDEMEVSYNKLNKGRKYSLVQSTTGSTVKVKQEKLKKEKYSNP